MKSKIKSTPDFSVSSPNHMEIVGDKDKSYLWSRNVIDRYKEMSDEDIQVDLQLTAHPFAVLFENWTGNYNVATGVRNANGFNAKEIFYFGNKSLDSRGMVGVQNYSPIQWLSSMDELIKLKERYTFVGVDNIPGSVAMETYAWPTPCILVFGEEGAGLTPGMQALCQDIVAIQMHGSIRSFNVGTASGIAMFDLVTKYRYAAHNANQ